MKPRRPWETPATPIRPLTEADKRMIDRCRELDRQDRAEVQRKIAAHEPMMGKNE